MTFTLAAFHSHVMAAWGEGGGGVWPGESVADITGM